MLSLHFPLLLTCFFCPFLPLFSPLINSVFLSCALSTISFLFLSYMLTRWLLILPRCTKNVMHSLSFFPFSLPKSPLHSLIQKHLCNKLQNSALLHLPPLWQSSRSSTYLLNSCGTNTAVTRSQLIKLPKIFEVIMPCDWYLPAIKLEKYSFSRGSSEVKWMQPKDINSKSPRGVALLSEENWHAVRGNGVFCEWGFTQRLLQVKCNKLVHKPHDLTPTKFLILENKRVWGSFSAPSRHNQLLCINDSGASLPAGKLTQTCR